ncbi:hypothetical protein EV665_1126 [Shinella granuli]|uniref:Uncharacterized protein n=1 Tax=Shinella granuli TaxID=323621 RepID=A0A4R2CQ79_SHIGR|nr:hypothetical protein EV665_1126 [Shinella granuli]
MQNARFMNAAPERARKSEEGEAVHYGNVCYPLIDTPREIAFCGYSAGKH